MALSDLSVFNEYARDAYIEVDAQNTEAFNEASAGTIVLSSAENEGDISSRSFISDTAGLIRVRNPNSAAVIASVAIQQQDAVSVKVARGTAPTRVNHSDWSWIQQDPAAAGVAYGRQMAVGSLADKLNTVIGAGVAALTNEGTNVYDAVATTDKKASLANLVFGTAKMGDQSGQLRAWVIHSKNMHDIYASAIGNASQLFQIGNVRVMQDGFGKVFVVTDSPNLVAASVYSILGLTERGLVVEDNNDFFTNIHTANGTDTIQTTMQSEWTYNVGVKGFAYDYANGGQAPSNATLFTGTSWDKVATNAKNLAGVIVKVN